MNFVKRVANENIKSNCRIADVLVLHMSSIILYLTYVGNLKKKLWRTFGD